MSLNATSPGCTGLNSLPSSIDEVPLNLTYIFKPHTDKSLSAMQTCCAPSEVREAQGGCFLWCEVPDSAGLSQQNATDALDRTSACVKEQGVDTGLTGKHVAAKPSSRAGRLQVGVVVLVASLLVSGL